MYAIKMHEEGFVGLVMIFQQVGSWGREEEFNLQPLNQ